MISNAIIAPIQLNALKVIDVHLKLTGEESNTRPASSTAMNQMVSTR